MSGTCLGEAVAALVDGELDHAARERAQRHLAHCAGCRAEVEQHRRLKVRLAGLADTAPPPSDALTARLLALPVPGTDRVLGAPAVPARPVTLRAPAGPGGAGPGRRRPRRSRAAVASSLAVLGLAALALGGPRTAATTPVDPATDSFVVQHVGTTSDGPRLVRTSLTGEGARSPR